MAHQFGGQREHHVGADALRAAERFEEFAEEPLPIVINHLGEVEEFLDMLGDRTIIAL